MQLDGIDHVALSVSNLKRSAQWYMDVLGFEERYGKIWKGSPTFLVRGQSGLALFPADHGHAQAQPQQHGFRHLAFRANAANFLAAQKELNERGIEITFQDHEVSHSIYFSDPDGHKLEITTYEI